MNANKIIIFCAPSGAGKTTIVRSMMSLFPVLAHTVSVTNRPIRTNEVNGVDYRFVSTEEFNNKIGKKEFVEWEEVYKGIFYGTLKSEIERLQTIKKIPIFDIDVKGAMSLKKMYGDKALVFFIKVPLNILKNRLIARNTETQETLNTRINRVKEEMEYENLADVVIVNIDLQEAINECQKNINNFLGIK